MRTQVSDDAIDRRTGRHHHENAARRLERLHQFLRALDTGDRLSLSGPVKKSFHFPHVEVVSGHGEALALDVAREACAHDTKSDDPHEIFHDGSSASAGGGPTRYSNSPARGTTSQSSWSCHAAIS